MKVLKAIVRALAAPGPCCDRPRTRMEIYEASRKYTEWQRRNGYIR